MDAADRAIAEIEGLSARDIQRRNIGPLAAFTRGNLARAAASIARHPSPSIAIITGFYLGHGEPPNCETDGPPGAAMLAAGFAAAGIPCRIATDLVNARVVRATAAAADPESRIPIDIVSMRRDGSDGATPLGQVEETWRRQHPPITHVISIERCGPSRDGCPRDARGVDMTDCNAPLEILFDAGPWTTIGIGDLGNEIGMGSLPYELVAASVPRGDQLWCRVACDHPIVGGVSNWAGAALLGACALLWPRGAGGDAGVPQARVRPPSSGSRGMGGRCRGVGPQRRDTAHPYVRRRPALDGAGTDPSPDLRPLPRRSPCRGVASDRAIVGYPRSRVIHGRTSSAAIMPSLRTKTKSSSIGLPGKFPETRPRTMVPLPFSMAPMSLILC